MTRCEAKECLSICGVVCFTPAFSDNFDLLRSLEKVELIKLRDDLIYWLGRLDGLTEDQIYEKTRVLKL